MPSAFLRSASRSAGMKSRLQGSTETIASAMTLMEISRRHAGSRQPSWGRMNMKETSAVVLRAARPQTTAFSFGMSNHSKRGLEKTRPLHFSAIISRSSDLITQKMNRPKAGSRESAGASAVQLVPDLRSTTIRQGVRQAGAGSNSPQARACRAEVPAHERRRRSPLREPVRRNTERRTLDLRSKTSARKSEFPLHVSDCSTLAEKARPPRLMRSFMFRPQLTEIKRPPAGGL